MTAAEISLLAVVFGFIALVFWVYSPRRRKRLESYGSMPLEEQEPGKGDDEDSRSDDQAGTRS